MNKNYKKKLFDILLVICWAILIFILSNVTAVKSSSDSSNIIMNTLNILIKLTNTIGITNYNPDVETLESIVKSLNNPLREFMHFFVYYVLSVLLIVALKRLNVKKVYIITFIICTIYAFSDEFHQLFIDGRTWEIIDLVLDTMGCITGCIFMKIISKKNSVI